MANLTVFESALSAMTANAAAMSVASNNIANVNTPGFARQRVVLASRVPQSEGTFELGRGVDVEAVERVVNDFSELRLTNATSSKGQYDALASGLQQVEAAFNEIGRDGGLAKYMGDFFNSFHTLANDAASRTGRLNALNAASILVDRFHKLSQNLVDQRTLINGDVKDRVTKMNSIATEIVDINGRIGAADSQTQLGLRDQRTKLTRDLSQYVDTRYVETTNGEYQVYIAQGMQLVAGTTKATLATTPNAGNSGLADVTFTAGTSSAITITSRINDGELKGMITARDTTIPGYQTLLDETAFQLVSNVNALHTTGFGLDGVTGRRFFGLLAAQASSAANISLDAAVDGIPNAIGASSTLAGIPGGNTIARSIAATQDTSVAFSTGSTTFDGFYSNLLTQIGNDVATKQEQATFAGDVQRQSQVERERISGVSLEEEQMSILKFQAAFQAASRLVNIADEILKTLSDLVQ